MDKVKQDTQGAGKSPIGLKFVKKVIKDALSY
jgi:hypothetical protein